jgi:hypothetical protein
MQAFCQILCKTEVQHHVRPVKWELLPPVAQKKTLKLQPKKNAEFLQKKPFTDHL